jgi:hypothetical protein
MWERLSSRDKCTGYINEIAAGKPLPQIEILIMGGSNNIWTLEQIKGNE